MSEERKAYIVDYSVERKGWCVFKRNDDISMSFHAGPFTENAKAQSEAKRLNDLAKSGEA